MVQEYLSLKKELKLTLIKEYKSFLLMKNIISVIVFFLIANNCIAQIELKGYVKSFDSTKPIPYCSVLIKSDSTVVTYTITNKEGFYIINLSENYKKLIIETSIINYLPSREELIIENHDFASHILNFSLKERITNLKEVYIEAKKPPITIKKDTTEYNLNQFKDGSERVVEDLLKNLPGITIKSNGAIEFKGKQVTRVLLDGDNVFDENYTVGTKNIDSEIVESVQAIEDYNSNYLLKGIKSSQDVAVNLVLKKGAADISGNTEVGFGIENKKHIKVNAILVSKKLKGFSTFSNNNIGENYSPYNFSSNTLDIAKTNEINQRTNNLIRINNLNSVLPDNRTSINNNYFGSINTLYKINNKLSLRLNYGVFNDKLIRTEINEIDYNFEDGFSVKTREDFVKTPKKNIYEYEMIYHVNKKSLFTSEGKLDFQKETNTSKGLNNDILFENSTKSKDLFFTNNFQYTNRFNAISAFQLTSIISTNNLPQNINVISASENFNQKLDFRKNVINLEAKLFSKPKKSEYFIALGCNYDENFMDSELQGVTIENQFLSNDTYYNIFKIYLNINYKYNIKRWQFSANLDNSVLNIGLNDGNLISKYNDNVFLLNPSFSANYYINKKSYLYSNYSLSNKIPEVSKTYSGLVLINNRTLLSNDFNFNIINNSTLNTGFRINDFYNLFQFHLYAKYGFQKYGYVNRLNVSQNNNLYTSIVDVTNNKNLNFGLSIEKYMHLLKSTFNIDSFYSIDEYQNIINNSGLRDNRNKSFFGKIEIRSGFKGAFNFSNKAELTFNKFETISRMPNAFTTFQNDFSIKYIKRNYQLSIDSQYFHPDLKSNISGDLFLDTRVSFKSQNEKIEYVFKANNLLNKKVYRNINSNDFSTSIFEHNLLERFFLISVNFKF